MNAELDAVARGGGGLTLIVGEAGIGKTRLLEEGVREAERRGFACAWGRGWEMGGAPPFWTWIEALRGLARAGGGAAAPKLEGAGETERFLLFDDVTTYLRRASNARPVLLVLDDLHACDGSSLQLTEFVARQLTSMPVALFASHRDLEARRSQEVWSSLMRLGRVGHVLRPPRLGKSDVGALIREVLGDDAGVTEMVHDASGGNPLFVRELVQLVAARSRQLGGSDVPDGVRAVIRQRLALLSPAAVALLSAAAIVGREFSVPVLSEVAGVTPSRIAEALEEARGADILEAVAPGWYRFSHVLVAESLVQELPPESRMRRYRATAEVLERLHAEDPGAPWGDIAEHYHRAGPEAAQHASRTAVRAAEQAMHRLAFEDGAAWFGRALGFWDVAAPGDARGRGELLLRLGEAHLHAGARDAALAACAKAADLARQLGLGDLLARAALTLGSEAHTGVSDTALVAMLDEARAALPQADSPLRARVLARLAGALQPALDPAPPMALAREAIDMARRLDDRSTLLDVLHAANAALIDYAPAEEQIALNEEAAALATARSARPQALRAQLRLAFAHLGGADVDGFARSVRGYDQLAQDFRHPRYQWQSVLLRSMQPLWRGSFEEAAAMEEEARALVEKANDANGARALLMRKAVSLANRTMEDGLVEAFRDVAGFASDADMRATFEVWARARLGDRAAAEVACRGITDRHLAAILADPNFAAAFVDVVALARHRHLAEVFHRHFAPAAGRLVVASGLGFCVQELVDRLLFALADVLDRPADADRHASEALACAAALGAAPFQARLKGEWAAALLRRGEASRAQSLAAQARVVATELGMPGLLRQLSALGGGEVPVARPRATPSHSRPIEMRREGELWAISGCGELCRLKDSRGLQLLAQLLAAPERDVHVMDLVGATHFDGGDAGEVLDPQARGAYASRLEELREELAEATSWNDVARRARLAEEANAITQQLNAAIGLGGRSRRAGSAVERARVNVQRRIADSLKRIAEAAPTLGRTLAATVRTGVFCSYRPLI
jgi:hypothetical protein